jgi:amino acid adenylation domain-containing protein
VTRVHDSFTETPVALYVDRAASAIVGMLGVLEAGGCYVPVDPNYPRARVLALLADSGAPVVLTQSWQRAALDAHLAAWPSDRPRPRVVTLTDEGLVESADASDSRGSHDARESRAAFDARAARDGHGHDGALFDAGLGSEADGRPVLDGDALAYVMYTSGSTGQPKGVAVPHRGITRLVDAASPIRFGPDIVTLHHSPIAFDASTLEVWGALLSGGTVVLCRTATPSLAELGALIRAHGVTTVWLPAGLFHLLVDQDLSLLAGVRQVLAGGDVLSVPHVRRAAAALPACTVINGYGPTENTTFTCCYPVGAGDELADSVPIGRPIPHTQVYVLDAQQQPVPVGVAGELYTGGAGLARGYWRQPALTAERFVDVPGLGRLYRTGDQVRWRADGTLLFLGRQDTQIKLRGFRIELGEIEAALRADAAVRDAVVIVTNEGAPEPPHPTPLPAKRGEGAVYPRP